MCWIMHNEFAVQFYSWVWLKESRLLLAVFLGAVMVPRSHHRNPEAHIAFKHDLHSKATSILDLLHVKDR